MAVTVNAGNIDVNDTGADFASNVKTEMTNAQADLGKMSEKTATETISGDKTMSGSFERSNFIYAAHSTGTDSISFDGTKTYITWTEDRSDSIFSTSTTVVTVSDACDLVICYDGAADIGVADAGHVFDLRFGVEIDPDGVSGYSVVTGSYSPFTLRGIFGNINNASCTGIHASVSSGALVRVFAEVYGRGTSGESANLVAQACRLRMQRI
tara:strand:- start:7627 stop:8259 length:633 start_codon:yes stop_codon:yes gene_type:complete